MSSEVQGLSRRLFSSLSTALWFGLFAYVALRYVRSEGGITSETLNTAISWLGFLLLFAFFLLVHAGVRVSLDVLRKPEHEDDEKPSPKAFPAPITITVGIWLLANTAVLLAGLFFALNPADVPLLSWLFSNIAGDPNPALITMFAAGIGSTIATIRGYLKHVSDLRDFDQAYVPWYFARPLLGMLLGLVFYFVMRGGLLATTGAAGEGEQFEPSALAAIGSLVGLFSNQAIEKLRELFNTLFITREELINELENGESPENGDSPDDDTGEDGDEGTNEENTHGA